MNKHMRSQKTLSNIWILLLVLSLGGWGFFYIREKCLSLEIRWVNYQQARAIPLGNRDKILMLYFYRSQDPPCEKLDLITFKNKDVLRIINQYFVSVKVNGFDKKHQEPQVLSGEDLDNKFSVKEYPTIVFLDSNQVVIRTIVGYRTPKEFINELISIQKQREEKK
jgi:thioredoxin-related protein